MGEEGDPESITTSGCVEGRRDGQTGWWDGGYYRY